MDGNTDTSDGPPPCSESGCASEADFYVFSADSAEWFAICSSHATHLHPSLEVHAWLESGYMKPVELGKPDRAPSEPRGGRANAFRTEVEEMMGWSE